MKKFLWGFIGLVFILLAILFTTGIPIPTITRVLDCEGFPVVVRADPHVRIQNFRLTIAGEISTKSKPEILKCATAILKREAAGKKLRDHAVKNITVTDENRLKINAFIRWYQNRYFHDGKNIDLTASFLPHDLGAIIKYSVDVRNVPPWFQDIIAKRSETTGEKIINKSDFGKLADFVSLDSIRLIQGEEYGAHIVLSMKFPR